MSELGFVAYLRVSTDRQGKSGLGLEAQRKAVVDHVASKGQIAAEYVEIESGDAVATVHTMERILAVMCHELEVMKAD